MKLFALETEGARPGDVYAPDVSRSSLMTVLMGARWPFPSASLALGGAPWAAPPYKDYSTITVHLLSEAALPL